MAFFNRSNLFAGARAATVVAPAAILEPGRSPPARSIMSSSFSRAKGVPRARLPTSGSLPSRVNPVLWRFPCTWITGTILAGEIRSRPRPSRRQKACAAALGEANVYTPQVIVNGLAGAAGGVRAEIAQAIDGHGSRWRADRADASIRDWRPFSRRGHRGRRPGGCFCTPGCPRQHGSYPARGKRRARRHLYECRPRDR